MIYATLATIPGREGLCRNTRLSLSRQVEDVHVVRSEIAGRTDDARKFYPVVGLRGYVLICDDDLVYPQDYADHMIQAVDRFDRKAVVTLMGRVVLGESSSYYLDKSAARKFDWRIRYHKDQPVHIPGTGVMAFHTDLMRPRFPDDFPEENMADLMIGAYCSDRGIPIMRVDPPRDNWIALQHTGGEDIWTWHHKDCETQTRIFNETEWVK